MKKKLVMKKWVENLVLIIGCFALLIVMSECSNMMIFIISHLIAVIIFGFVGYMLMKYGRESDE